MRNFGLMVALIWPTALASCTSSAPLDPGDSGGSLAKGAGGSGGRVGGIAGAEVGGTGQGAHDGGGTSAREGGGGADPPRGGSTVRGGTSEVDGRGGDTGGQAGGSPHTGSPDASGGARGGGAGASGGGRLTDAGAGGNRRAEGGASGTEGTADAGATPLNGSGPCDIYAAGNTPCVAAHSTTRALYSAYAGNLYQVKRADKSTKDIGVLSPGGFADSATQESFCSGAKCTISIIYDQSGKGNHLTSAPAGGAKNTPDSEAVADALELKVGGHTVYGVHIPAGTGYRNNKTVGIAIKDEPESMYMVTGGKYYNGGCCFDYGNAETNSKDNGNGTMEAIYFGNCKVWGYGSGQGPWVMADLENGLFSGKNSKLNEANTSISAEYVTAMIKGKQGTWAIKAGDSQSGGLKTLYEGGRPANGYDPMKKEGAIILGIGGDNSNSAQGNFFEGVMTSGYASDATDSAIQANIVAALYGR